MDHTDKEMGPETDTLFNFCSTLKKLNPSIHFTFSAEGLAASEQICVSEKCIARQVPSKVLQFK